MLPIGTIVVVVGYRVPTPMGSYTIKANGPGTQFVPYIGDIGIIVDTMILEDDWPSYMVYIPQRGRFMPYGRNEIEVF